MCTFVCVFSDEREGRCFLETKGVDLCMMLLSTSDAFHLLAFTSFEICQYEAVGVFVSRLVCLRL